MRKIKNKLLYFVSIPIIAIACIVSLNIIYNEGKQELKHEFVYKEVNERFHRVYLLDDSNMLVPLTVEVNSKENLVDEIYTVIANLRDLEVEGFTNTLAKDIKINKIELKDGILNIDFSNEFLTYNKDLEEKILESLTWSVLDFKEIKGLTISVDGNELKKMPLNGFVLPNVLDKSIGINKYHDMINKCSDCSSVIVVYSKVINDKEYYIPVTRNVINNDNFEFVEAYNMEVSVLSGLNKVYDLSNLNDLKVEDNILKVNVSNEYLIEENIINENIYNLWSVVSYFNDYEYEVSFFVDGESVMVNGYQSLEKEVGLININEIKI